MATNSIPDQQLSDNIPPHLAAAIEAAGTLAGQVGQHRLDAGIALATAGQVSRNPAGGFDVTSRTTGTPYHINGASCTCKDAEYGAPWVLGRKACAHQVAVWIVIKAARLAAQGAEVAAPAAIQPGTQPASEPASELVELPLADLIAAAANVNGTTSCTRSIIPTGTSPTCWTGIGGKIGCTSASGGGSSGYPTRTPPASWPSTGRLSPHP